MNLIEQFGGYEKSKRELKLKEYSSMFQCCTAITEDMIRDALLEHRRENNIFEAGDFIVYGSITALFIIEQESTPMLLRHSRTGRIFRKPVGGNIRHATPQEIAQGYRDE